MNTFDFFWFPFHWFKVSTKYCLHSTIPRFNQVLIMTILPWFVLVKITDMLSWSIPKRQKPNLRYRTYKSSNGILTVFPFLITSVTKLVRINLLLTDLHCQETLALSAAEILTLLSSYYHQDSHFKEVHIFSRTCFCPLRTPAYHSHECDLQYRQSV